MLDVDLAGSAVVTTGRRIGFDFLIVATGARHAYFGHDEWEPVAPGLKQIDEATDIRRRLLLAFEKAEVTADATMRRSALTFAVVGGGPTGVEMAGSIAELARTTLVRDYRSICTSDTRVVLIEAGPRLLPSFPERLSASAEAQLTRLKVDVLKGDPVTACTATGVTLKSGSEITAELIVWGAGVMASPAAKWLKAEADRAGRVVVGPDLRLPGPPRIFVIRDTAAVVDASGIAAPGVAPAAKQMGQHVAPTIKAVLAGRTAPPFRYWNYRNLATIGRGSALADFGRVRLTGSLAWAVWSVAHLGFLIGFRNRATVMLDWAWSYFFFARGARLITGDMTDGPSASVRDGSAYKRSSAAKGPPTGVDLHGEHAGNPA